MRRIPLLLISDDPRKGTGLGRITKDLADRMAMDAEFSRRFQVGVLGVFGEGFQLNPYPIYSVKGGIDEVYRNLGMVWKDFAGGGFGIITPVCSPNWLWELTNAEEVAKEHSEWWPVVRMWERRPWKLWPYAAVEGEFRGRFNFYVTDTLGKCDRVLMYSKWGMRLAEASGLDMGKIDWCHHGVDTEVFRFQPEAIRSKEKLVLGCVATNNPRKLMSLLIHTVAELKEKLKGRVILHLHTNVLVDVWDIPLLINDFGVQEYVTVSLDRWNDETVAKFYNRCHVTVLPTSGEGFGFPVLESACCGTSCVTGEHGAQSELPCLPVAPRELIVHGHNNDMLPIYRAGDLADVIVARYKQAESGREELAKEAKKWDWQEQWPKFKRWFMEGLR